MDGLVRLISLVVDTFAGMSDFFAATLHALTPWPLFLMSLGTALGIIVGAIPGLTGALLITLSLPLTFSMSGTDAMVLLVSMYVGSISGGLIAATLLRIPGTPASMMTTLDGYPLAQSGRAGRALGLGIGASLVGGLVSWLCLVGLARPMSALAIQFGPFEFFSLVLVALVLVANMGRGALLPALFSACLGILVSMPGVSPSTGKLRLTFGLEDMNAGFKLLPVLIGVFALNQAMQEIVLINGKGKRAAVQQPTVIMSWSDCRRHATNLFRSSLIGTWVGILPGVGANIGSAMAYSAAKSVSKRREEFGRGSEEGIIASEAANNATVGGALVPLVSMGIPGSVIDAILLGALVMHGLQPGPRLFDERPEVVYTIMVTVLLANVFMYLFMTATAGKIARMIFVPRAILVPGILTFCVIGSYALSNRMYDVWVMLAFGVLGFAMERARIPLPPFVIGLVLGPIAEENLVSGLMASGGSYLPLVTRPLSLLFCLVGLGVLLWPILKSCGARLRSR